MKISGVGTGAPASGAKRTDKTERKGEFRKALIQSMDTMEEAHALEAPASLNAVDSLLLVQSVGDSTERESRGRMIRRGEDILDRLEEVRRGLLLGEIPEHKLAQLADVIRSHRGACADPQLGSLLDEIELRAEVELAKLSRGR